MDLVEPRRAPSDVASAAGIPDRPAIGQVFPEVGAMYSVEGGSSKNSNNGFGKPPKAPKG